MMPAEFNEISPAKINLFFISLKVGISFLLMSSENINIFPLEVKFFFDKRKIFFISLN